MAAVVVPGLLLVVVVVRNPTYSPLDEHAHSDYVRRVEDGEVPRVGDRVLQETVADVQCRTTHGRRAAPCGLPEYDVAIVGASGFQYEAQQPPVYYAVTAALRQVTRIGPVDSFLVSARLTGVAWLVGGLLTFFVACRRLGCGWWPTATATVLLGIGPGVLYQGATVNNDAAAILTGSLALLMFAHLREGIGARRLTVWAAVAVALVMVKPTGIVAVGVAGGALLFDAIVDRRLDRRHAIAFLVPVLAGLVAYGAWSSIRAARATVDYDVVLEALLHFKMTDEVPWEDLPRTLTRLLDAYAPIGVPINPPWVQSPATLVMAAFTAVGASALWVARGGAMVQRLAGVALLGLLLGGPAFTVLFYVDYSVEGGPAPRYGLSLLPLVFVGGAWTFRTRRSLIVLLALGGLSVAFMLREMY
jgi:hypothetical protein